MSRDNETPRSGLLGLYQGYSRLSLGVRILIFMILGIVAGIVFREHALIVEPLGDLFIRLLMMAAIPLVFFNLVAGLTSLPDIGVLGRLGGRILVYYTFTTATALALGLIVMHALQPGAGMTLTGEVEETFGDVPSVTNVLLELVPENIFAAFSDGKLTQVVVFAVFLGVTALLLPSDKRRTLQNAFDVLAELFRKLVEVIMIFGPIGIGSLAAATVGKYGSTIFGPMAIFIGGVWGAQAMMAVIYLILLYGFTRRSPFTFLKQTAPLYATTAATCSSLASLVVALRVAEDRVKLPRNIYSFTLPLGAQLNKDGSAIMLAGVLLFTAQASGVTFTLASQVTILLVGLLLTTGSGGIPGGGMVIALLFVQAFNLPVEIAIIVSGIYRMIDMGNTTLNCMGDMVGTIIVSDLEGHRDESVS
jgi:Na+/H+-dicarboxylate symporter